MWLLPEGYYWQTTGRAVMAIHARSALGYRERNNPGLLEGRCKDCGRIH